MNDLPPDMSPDEFDRMIARHARQLSEHCLGVAIVCLRVEDNGQSGFYARTGGSHHAAEKALDDFALDLKVRREERFRRRANVLLDRQEGTEDPPPDDGDAWKRGE